MFARISVIIIMNWLALTGSAEAGRLYGTANVSWQHTETEGNRLILVQRPGSEEFDQVIIPINSADDLNSETLLLNYEDVLFYKNRLRFSAYLYRRELGLSDNREFRPIYSAELRSHGYFLSSSLSPFTEHAATQTGTGLRPVEIKHSEWRNTLSVAYPSYPSFALVWNKNVIYDTETERRINGETRNLLVETGYTLGSASARLNYSNLRQENRQAFPFTNVQRNYTGSISVTEQIGKVGYFSSNYTYYNSRSTRENTGLRAITHSHNHSFAAMIGSQQWRNLSATTSYSGRFASSKIDQRTNESDNQSLAGQLNYRPLRYLSFDATKSYQINTDQAVNDINENLSVAATLTKSIRRGVDTRFMASRIFVQQSAQITSDSDGQYTLDTYYASLSFEPHGFIRTILDASMTHNSEPFNPQQRYQMNMSLNSRMFISRTLEGRFNMTALYQGAKFELGRSYSQNLNIGATYSPQSNLSLNASYLYTVVNGAQQIKSGTWIGYGAYSFRRIYTISVSGNYQEQESPIATAPGKASLVTNSPYTVTGQIQINLAPRTTLTTAYAYTETPTRTGQKTIDRAIHAIFNVQL